MARHRTTPANTTTTGRKPGMLSRLGGRKRQQDARVTESTSTNPITGTTTRTTKTTTHPNGIGHHGHAGRGPLASSTNPGTTTTKTGGGPFKSSRKARTTGTTARKPTMGDKISGALTKMRGSLTGKPGVKAAGTRRMHGTDGKGTHRTL